MPRARTAASSRSHSASPRRPVPSATVRYRIRRPAGRMGVDPEVLTGTLEQYNASARAGRDEAFGRSADTLVPLDLGRLYAIETWPGIAGTTGGPRHDERARVLRPDGQPVPGLYAAGAVSLTWGHLIEHGGGLTDAMVFGRIAGTEAAARAASAALAATAPG